MAKGTATPSKVQQQRESAAAMGKGDSSKAADILKKIEADEAEAFRKFQDEQKAKREKALADVLEPLKKRRSELSQMINEGHNEIAEIDRQLSKLTGHVAPGPKTGGKQRKERLKGEALQQAKAAEKAAGSKLFSLLKKAGVGVEMKSKELKPQVLGSDVKKSLMPYIDAKLVRIHPNGPQTAYSFVKDGEPAAA